MKTGYVYLKVKAYFEYPDDADLEQVADQISSHCDYNVSYDEDGIKVIDTELMGIYDTGDCD